MVVWAHKIKADSSLARYGLKPGKPIRWAPTREPSRHTWPDWLGA